MSNQHYNRSRAVTFEAWLNKHSMLKLGFLSVYNDEDFNPEINSSAYEVGRQMAIIAKSSGYKTRGALIRRKPKSDEYAWVKTKTKELECFARSLGYAPSDLTIRNVA